MCTGFFMHAISTSNEGKFEKDADFFGITQNLSIDFYLGDTKINPFLPLNPIFVYVRNGNLLSETQGVVISYHIM